MGRMTDAVIALIVLVVGLYVLTKLGITWDGIWKMIHTFFSGSTTTNGTASSIIVGIGMTASNSKVRNKVRTREELRIRLQKFKECSSLITRRVRRRA